MTDETAGSTAPAAPVFSLKGRNLLAPVALIVVVVLVVFTPGFLSTPSLLSLVNSASLIGCVAVGMTLITISGNVLAFSLGVATGCTAMVFAALTPLGGGTAAIAALASAIVITGLQGFVIGFFRANPIIVSIAALGLITGCAEFVSQGQTVYSSYPALAFLKGKFLGVPAAGYVFLATAIAGELLLRFSRFGRNLRMVGSNIVAADAVGVVAWRTITGVYSLAGLFAGFAGLLLATRYGAGSLQYGMGYDYSAIAAVLVGGTFIGGGEGSVTRTFVGVLLIAAISNLLLLHGVPTEYQYLLTGLIIFGAVLAQTRKLSR